MKIHGHKAIHTFIHIHTYTRSLAAEHIHTVTLTHIHHVYLQSYLQAQTYMLTLPHTHPSRVHTCIFTRKSAYAHSQFMSACTLTYIHPLSQAHTPMLAHSHSPTLCPRREKLPTKEVRVAIPMLLCAAAKVGTRSSTGPQGDRAHTHPHSHLAWPTLTPAVSCVVHAQALEYGREAEGQRQGEGGEPGEPKWQEK